MTPSHNPPADGGFKYNPPNGGPADETVTAWIGAAANALLEAGPDGVRRVPLGKALRAATTHRHDFLRSYVGDLGKVRSDGWQGSRPVRSAGLSWQASGSKPCLTARRAMTLPSAGSR